MADAQRILLDCLALVTRMVCIPGSHKIVVIREAVTGMLLPPGHCTDSRMKHSPHLSEEQAYLLFQESEGQVRL